MKKEIRMALSDEIYERIEAQASNYGVKPGAWARQVIMEKVIELEKTTLARKSLNVLEVLQKMEETGK